jgi:hypothetical protein
MMIDCLQAPGQRVVWGIAVKEVGIITPRELEQMAEAADGLVKAAVDVSLNRLVVDMELHADGEAYLLESGSRQQDVWGINLYPSMYGTDQFIEYDSIINMRPRQGNRSREVLDEAVRSKIAQIVHTAISEE